MALPDLDPRNGGSCSNCLANKFLCYVIAYVQMMLWICSLFTVMFDPGSMRVVVEKNDTAVTVIAIIILLVSIVFSALLLVGLHKGKQVFLKSYCIYAGSYVLLMIISLVVTIFVQPSRLGVRGFFSTIFNIILQAFFLVVVRSYYLLHYCNAGRQANIRATI
ncbi:uncharacterized protein LOC113503877 isoform X2 [Trichoplusia ni]|nr:uncharacterized protein LOC113503877 isoform X2 [Trichoplusia ni]